MPPSRNLLPLQGLQYILASAMPGGSPVAGLYLALYGGAVNPLSTWNAANVASQASEITSPTEGYSNANRPAWVPGTMAVDAARIGNLESLCQYNIVCATSIQIQGAFLISSNAKGGASGTLVSAGRFDQVNILNNGATFELGYEVELQDS